jgi:pimeloyl-ACP methyl ester carboxylesterase
VHIWLLLVLLAPEPDLAAVVDLPTPKERRAAAFGLARREDVTLEGLLAAMRAFAPRGAPQAGTTNQTVPLLGVETDITIHVPESHRHTQPAGLILALHGAGGHGPQEAYRWRAVAEELGYLIVAPTEAGENRGYGFTPDERAATLAALRWARRHLDVDENRIHLSGASRSGHLTWDLGLRHPDRWASLSPMIGGPRLEPSRGKNNLRFLENVAHLPIRDLQGEGDDKRLLFNLRLAFFKLEKLGATNAKLLTFPDLGHSYRFEAVEWKAFLARARREPAPARVVRLCADAREGRAYWVEISKTKRPVKEALVPQVKAAEWNAMDDGARRRFLAAEAERRTARLEVKMVESGVFLAESTHVGSFRLLLSAEMFDPGQPVRVTWNGRTRQRKLKASKRVLLQDFAERFDRTFLPVAEFKIP